MPLVRFPRGQEKIALTPQLVEPPSAGRFTTGIAVLHSALTGNRTLGAAWRPPYGGSCQDVIVRRSAVFTAPAAALVDPSWTKEHDASLQAARGIFLYSARAFGRGAGRKAAQVPIILVSARPRLKTLKRGRRGLYGATPSLRSVRRRRRTPPAAWHGSICAGTPADRAARSRECSRIERHLAAGARSSCLESAAARGPRLSATPCGGWRPCAHWRRAHDAAPGGAPHCGAITAARTPVPKVWWLAWRTTVASGGAGHGASRGDSGGGFFPRCHR